MSEPKAGRTTLLLGIAALGTSAAVCGAGGIAMAVLSARGGTGNPGGYFGPDPLPPPGNPKGSFYEAPDVPLPDVPPPDAGVPVLPPPGNPKGTLYDEPPVPPPESPPPPPSKR